MRDDETGFPDIPGLVKDQFYNRKVTVYQKKKGYRFSLDAPFLADFLPYRPEDSALEIGPGSGVISMLTLYHNKFRNVEAIEIQKDFSEISDLNSRENSVDDRFTVYLGDFCSEWERFKGVKNIYSNPPFMPLTGGRISPNEEIAIAKNEVKINLKQLVVKTREIISDDGDLFLVLPWARYSELVDLAEAESYAVTRLRKVYNEADSGEPVRFLIQLSSYNKGFVEEEPLIIYKDKGNYSEEAERIFAGK